VTYTITHTSGAMEEQPPRDSIAALLDELDGADGEHPDVSVSHESGWTLSVFPSGRVIWENIEEDDEARHVFLHDRSEIEQLLYAVADGRVDVVDSAAWSPGYGT
jgi:hypothetical protein